jgi:hypothetical protein
MEINSLDKKTIYVHKRKDDKYFIENANADNVNIYVVLESRLINEEHQYYELSIATVNIDDILDDSTRLDIRHLIFKLLLMCTVDTDKTFNTVSITNNSIPVNLGFGKQSSSGSLQLMISYDFVNSQVIYWNDQAWVLVSETGSYLIENLMKKQLGSKQKITGKKV